MSFDLSVNVSLARIDAEIAQLEDLEADDLERELCAESLAVFARRAWHLLEPATPLKWGWALDAICLHLEAVTDGRIRRLLMNVPPGSMKSLLTSVIWPAWEWGPKGMPQTRYLGTAHKQDLAVRDNMKCRRLIQSGWYQKHWPLPLTGDQNAKTKFENGSTGFREAMAFTGMTGSRGDRVILDDPHSVDDANSAVKLAGDVVTFREALPSRVNNDQSAIVIIMQRLHESDVSAVALGLGYEHLCIPMRYEGARPATSIGWTDPRSTDGELMFPERFPESQVAELEESLGPYATAGQLQQRPAPRQGGIFKPDALQVEEAAPAGLSWIRAWDLASSVPKAGSDPDWTVGTKWAKDASGRFHIGDVVRMRGMPDEVEMVIVNTAAHDGRGVRISLPQDPGQAGKSQVLYLTKKLAGYRVVSSPETGDKITRAEPMAAQINVGNVSMLKAPWNDALVAEMRLFPNGSHDDQVDSSSRAFNDLTAAPTPMRTRHLNHMVR
jgi:predicted phage terminase large subunit-like protein